MANICSHFCYRLKIIFNYGKEIQSCFLVSRVTLSLGLGYVHEISILASMICLVDYCHQLLNISITLS